MRRYLVHILTITTLCMLQQDASAWSVSLTATSTENVFYTGSQANSTSPNILSIQSSASESDRPVQCSISSDQPLHDLPAWKPDVNVSSGANLSDGLFLASYVGEFGEETYFASGNAMYVVLNTSVSLTIKYKTQTNCEGTMYATRENRYLRTPGYPYPRTSGIDTSLSCTWFIITPVSASVTITLTLPDNVSCEVNDTVVVYSMEGENSMSRKRREIGRWCGGVDNKYISSTNLSAVTIPASLMASSGVQVEYRPYYGVTPCVEAIDVHEGLNGTITSTGYPNYLQELKVCRWYLRTPPDTKYAFNFTVLDSDLDNSPGCTKDTVTVYMADDYDSPPLARWCGDGAQDMEFYTNTLMVEIRTGLNHNGSYRGLNLHYQASKQINETFTFDLTSSSVRKNVTSLNYPMPYPSHIKETWRITATDPFNVVKFNFLQTRLGGIMPFMTYCPYGYILLYDGHEILQSSLLLRWCSSYTRMIFSHGPRATIVFVAENNAVSEQEGFVLEYWEGQYSAVLEPRIINQTISFPFHAGNYISGYDIFWNISSVSREYSVGVHFTDVDVKCPDDRIMIYDGERDWEQPSVSFCGQEARAYISKQPTLYIRFRSFSDQGRGFNFSYAEYYQSGCSRESSNRTVYRDWSSGSGYIKYPWGDYNYFDFQRCTWLLVSGMPQDRIRLEINIYDIVSNDTNTCPDDYLVVYDGYDKLHQPFPRICGHNKTVSINSTGQTLYIEFISDQLHTGQGFRMFLYSIPHDPPEESFSSIEVGPIVGIVIGVIVVILIVAYCVVTRRKSRRRANERNTGAPTVTYEANSRPPPDYTDVTSDSNVSSSNNLLPSYTEAVDGNMANRTRL